MVFEDFFWSKGKAKNDKWLKPYGHTVNLNQKRQSRWKWSYYCFRDTPFVCSFALPVDLQDLKAIKLGYPAKVMADFMVGNKTVKKRLSKEKIRKSCSRHGWLKTRMGRYEVFEWQVKRLVKSYPRKCGKCGYSRFQYLEIYRMGLGSSARFFCPYCGKRTNLDWTDLW